MSEAPCAAAAVGAVAVMSLAVVVSPGVRSLIAAAPRVFVVATADHVSSPIIFDQRHRMRYNWVRGGSCPAAAAAALALDVSRVVT